MTGPGRRRWLLAAIVAVTLSAAGVTAATVVLTRSGPGAAGPPPERTASAPPSGSPSATAGPAPTPTPPPPRGWWSGASGRSASNGGYAKWRGEPIGIGGAWVNGNAEQVQMFEICDPHGDWIHWNGPLDLAIGAIDVTRGETWSAAARGAYDARWRRHLQRTRQCWGARDPKLLYIRFAHEMNLERIPWRVRHGEEKAFVRALTRYSSLRYQILPGLNIVLCPNDGTEAGLGGLDIRKLWPGNDAQGRPIANVYAVDSYNQYPHVNSAKAFRAKITDSYSSGMPLGIEKHRQFAQSRGVPFAIGEWSNNGDRGARGGGGEQCQGDERFRGCARDSQRQSR